MYVDQTTCPLAAAMLATLVASSNHGPHELTRAGANGPFWIAAETFQKNSAQRRKASAIELQIASHIRAQRDQWRRRAGSADGPCPVMIVSNDHTGRSAPSTSFKSLTDASRAVYSGTISEVTAGFLSGVPSSVLTIRSLSAVAGAEGSRRRTESAPQFRRESRAPARVARKTSREYLPENGGNADGEISPGDTV